MPLVQKNNLSSGLWLLLLLFAFTIPLSQELSIKILVLMVVLSLLIKGPKSLLSQFVFQSWDAMLYIAILLVGLLYSEKINAGLQAVETSLSLIAMPFLFVKLKNFDNTHTHKIISSFCLGLFIACTICVVNAGLTYKETGDWTDFFFYNLTEVIGFQPTYYAYYLIFALTCTIYALYYGLTSIYRLVLVALSLFFFVMLILTGGWTAMVSLFYVFSFFLLKYLLEKKTATKSIAITAIGIMLASLFALHAMLDLDTKDSFGNDYWERSVLWEAALKANPNPLFGVGTGDSSPVLNNYYRAHGMMEFEKSNYNSHNQFIQTYFSQGLIGLIILFFLLGRPLYLSVKKEKTIVALIFFPFIVYGITEAFLGRYQGVVFFALLHQVFLHNFYHAPSYPILKQSKSIKSS